MVFLPFPILYLFNFNFKKTFQVNLKFKKDYIIVRFQTPLVSKKGF